MSDKLFTIPHASPLYIADMQGFKIWENDFIYKEAALLKVQFPSVACTSFLVKPPMAERFLSTRDVWRVGCETLLHDLSWECGTIPYATFQVCLGKELQNCTMLCVKGLEKVQWVKPYVSESCQVVDLETVGCPSLAVLRKNTLLNFLCPHHVTTRCAGMHVRILYEWMCGASCMSLGSSVL